MSFNWNTRKIKGLGIVDGEQGPVMVTPKDVLSRPQEFPFDGTITTAVAAVATELMAIEEVRRKTGGLKLPTEEELSSEETKDQSVAAVNKRVNTESMSLEERMKHLKSMIDEMACLKEIKSDISSIVSGKKISKPAKDNIMQLIETAIHARILELESA